MSRNNKRRLIILGIIIAIIIFFLAKGWVSKEELLQAGETLITGQSQQEVSLPEADFSQQSSSQAPQSSQQSNQQSNSQSGSQNSQQSNSQGSQQGSSQSQSAAIDEHGSYTSKEEVALYLHTYGRLPENYITKNEAKDRGWVSNKGNLWDVASGMSIGGDGFSNREGGLPDADGRRWYECDIDYTGGYRGAQRILYSSDGLIFYTDDHYETFTQLY